ncbi:MAG: hypothetical protein CMO55_11115 [Verrucomicrobiales bacterium]|nr:hypothetical protein [Verrucomicrobiales bacterium]
MKSPCTKGSLILPVIIILAGVILGLGIVETVYELIIFVFYSLVGAALTSITLSIAAFVRKETGAAFSFLLSFPSLIFLFLIGA